MPPGLTGAMFIDSASRLGLGVLTGSPSSAVVCNGGTDYFGSLYAVSALLLLPALPWIGVNRAVGSRARSHAGMMWNNRRSAGPGSKGAGAQSGGRQGEQSTARGGATAAAIAIRLALPPPAARATQAWGAGLWHYLSPTRSPDGPAAMEGREPVDDGPGLIADPDLLVVQEAGPPVPLQVRWEAGQGLWATHAVHTLGALLLGAARRAGWGGDGSASMQRLWQPPCNGRRWPWGRG